MCPLLFWGATSGVSTGLGALGFRVWLIHRGWLEPRGLGEVGGRLCGVCKHRDQLLVSSSSSRVPRWMGGGLAALARGGLSPLCLPRALRFPGAWRQRRL